MRALDDAGATEADVDRMAFNVHSEKCKSYLLNMPLKGMLLAAGFDADFPHMVFAAHLSVLSSEKSALSSLVSTLLPALLEQEHLMQAAWDACGSNQEAKESRLFCARGSCQSGERGNTPCSPPHMTSGSRKCRVGIIGTGCIGLEHIRNLHLVEAASLVAIAENHPASYRNALACLQAFGTKVRLFVDYRDLLADSEVDAVIICTPNDHHAEVFREVVASGKHCLVEKPLATTVLHCAVALALEREMPRPAVLWCAMEYRYIPSVARLINEADAGRIGTLRMLTILENRFPFLTKVGDWNRSNARTGGTLVEKCCHFFDLMRRILRSEPRSIYASGYQRVQQGQLI